MLNKDSALARSFWETGKLPCKILDFHAHMDEHPEIYFPFSSAAEMVAETIDRYKTIAYPAIIPIPGRTGAKGIGMKGVRANVEKAIGADIL